MNDKPDLYNAGVHDLSALQKAPETMKKETELLELADELTGGAA